MIAISQSGETADTLAALQLAKQKGCLVFGLCNNVGSTIARETDAGVYLHAGPEIGVASTKAFSAQVLTLLMIAVKLASERGELPVEEVKLKLRSISALPQMVRRVLKTQKDVCMQMARTYRYASNFLYLGRGYNFPVALEGALKLKEISYIHVGARARAHAYGPCICMPVVPEVPVVPVPHAHTRRYPCEAVPAQPASVHLAGGGLPARVHYLLTD